MLQDLTKSNTFNSALAPIVLPPRQFVSYFLSLFWGRATKVQQDRASSGDRKIAASLRRAAVKTHRNTTLQSRADMARLFFGVVLFCAGSS
jgi:hypothetical protein